MNYDSLTRSEASTLVELYMKCTNNPLYHGDGQMDKYRAPQSTFRIMTQYYHMGAVLIGKGPLNQHNEISDMFFNTINKLVEGVMIKEPFGETQKHIRTTFMNDVDKMKSLQLVVFLSCAVDNYLRENHDHIEQVLGDNTYEYNSCSVCDWSGDDNFYYSTHYGLNQPVCTKCVFIDEEKEEDREDTEFCGDLDYVQANQYDNHNETKQAVRCEKCQYEWRSGWKKGWKAAMKQIHKLYKQK